MEGRSSGEGSLMRPGHEQQQLQAIGSSVWRKAAASSHGEEHGRRGTARERRCGCWLGGGKMEEAGAVVVQQLHSRAMVAMVSEHREGESVKGRDRE